MDSLIHAVVADEVDDDDSLESSEDEDESEQQSASASGTEKSTTKRKKRQVTACARHRAMRKICPAGCPDRRAPKPLPPNQRYKKMYKPTMSSTRSPAASAGDSNAAQLALDFKAMREIADRSSRSKSTKKQQALKRAAAVKASAIKTNKSRIEQQPVNGIEPIRDAFPWSALIIEAMLNMGDDKSDKEIMDYIRDQHALVCRRTKNWMHEVSRALTSNVADVWMPSATPAGTSAWRLKRSLTDGVPSVVGVAHQASMPGALLTSPWHVTAEQHWTYMATFTRMNAVSGGGTTLSGTDVRDVWMTSKLPLEDLAHIWDLVDPQGTKTVLGPLEFAAGMHLITARLNGHALPAALPPELHQSLEAATAQLFAAMDGAQPSMQAAGPSAAHVPSPAAAASTAPTQATSSDAPTVATEAAHAPVAAPVAVPVAVPVAAARADTTPAVAPNTPS
eukprot:TRINITY_DN28034_c0_g1_i1.p2 TRINITY_DN28034_c0_g1~~TRINITY_DN28034_c0_g1_i1.p2  ORF type:complete len:450 (-),score=107.22 TRINITY_DN28034_c0_g1_i1:61-1410(-)